MKIDMSNPFTPVGRSGIVSTCKAPLGGLGKVKMTVTTYSGKSVSYRQVREGDGWIVEMSGLSFRMIQKAERLFEIFSESGIRAARGVNPWEAIRDLAEVAA
jgi:hypothetical protein